jgi:hypothetical protein
MVDVVMFQTQGKNIQYFTVSIMLALEFLFTCLYCCFFEKTQELSFLYSGFKILPLSLVFSNFILGWLGVSFF